MRGVFCIAEYLLPRRLQDTREDADLKQKDIAETFGITASAVSTWETGVADMSARQLFEVCQMLNVSADYLLGLDDRETVDITELPEADKQIVRGLNKHLHNRNSK